MYDSYEAKQAMHKLNQRTWKGLKLNVAYSTRKVDDTGKFDMATLYMTSALF